MRARPPGRGVNGEVYITNGFFKFPTTRDPLLVHRIEPPHLSGPRLSRLFLLTLPNGRLPVRGNTGAVMPSLYQTQPQPYTTHFGCSESLPSLLPLSPPSNRIPLPSHPTLYSAPFRLHPNIPPRLSPLHPPKHPPLHLVTYFLSSSLSIPFTTNPPTGPHPRPPLTYE